MPAAPLQDHRIGRLDIVVDVPDLGLAMALRPRLEALGWQILPQVLGKIFDRLALEGLHVQLDSLAVDLGRLRPAFLEVDAVRALEEALEDALVHAIHRVRHGNMAEGRLSTPLARRLELFEIYLVSGLIPRAPANQSFDLAEQLDELTSGDPSQLVAMLRRHARLQHVLERLVLQLGQAGLTRLLGVLAPADAEAILLLIGDIILVHHDSPAPELKLLTELSLQQLLWVTTLEFLLRDAGSQFNRRQFLAALLTREAKRLGIPLTALLALLADAVAVTMARAPLRTSLPRSLAELLATRSKPFAEEVEPAATLDMAIASAMAGGAAAWRTLLTRSAATAPAQAALAARLTPDHMAVLLTALFPGDELARARAALAHAVRGMPGLDHTERRIDAALLAFIVTSEDERIDLRALWRHVLIELLPEPDRAPMARWLLDMTGMTGGDASSSGRELTAALSAVANEATGATRIGANARMPMPRPYHSAEPKIVNGPGTAPTSRSGPDVSAPSAAEDQETEADFVVALARLLPGDADAIARGIASLEAAHAAMRLLPMEGREMSTLLRRAVFAGLAAGQAGHFDLAALWERVLGFVAEAGGTPADVMATRIVKGWTRATSMPGAPPALRATVGLASRPPVTSDNATLMAAALAGDFAALTQAVARGRLDPRLPALLARQLTDEGFAQLVAALGGNAATDPRAFGRHAGGSRGRRHAALLVQRRTLLRRLMGVSGLARDGIDHGNLPPANETLGIDRDVPAAMISSGPVDAAGRAFAPSAADRSAPHGNGVSAGLSGGDGEAPDPTAARPSQYGDAAGRSVEREPGPEAVGAEHPSSTIDDDGGVPSPLDATASDLEQQMAAAYLREGKPADDGAVLPRLAAHAPAWLARIARSAATTPEIAKTVADRLLYWLLPLEVLAVLEPSRSDDPRSGASTIDADDDWWRATIAAVLRGETPPPARLRDAAGGRLGRLATLDAWLGGAPQPADIAADLMRLNRAERAGLLLGHTEEDTLARLTRAVMALGPSGSRSLIDEIAPWAHIANGPLASVTSGRDPAARWAIAQRAAAAALHGGGIDFDALARPLPSPAADAPTVNQPSPSAGPPSDITALLAWLDGATAAATDMAAFGAQFVRLAEAGDARLADWLAARRGRASDRARWAAILPVAALGGLLRLLVPNEARTLFDAALLLTAADAQVRPFGMPRGDPRSLWALLLEQVVVPVRIDVPAVLGRLVAHAAGDDETRAAKLRSRAGKLASDAGRVGVATALRRQPSRAAQRPAPAAKSDDRAARFPMFGEEVEPSEPIYIANAGLVLVHAYLPLLFDRLGLIGPNEDGLPHIAPGEAGSRAVHLLQYLVDGHFDTPEPLLVLNKLLCGLPTATPVARGIDPEPGDLATCDGMLAAVLANWPALQNTPIAGLQETFLQREGRLRHDGDKWTLQVQRKTLDVLMDQVPWSLSVVYHRWMAKPIHVTW